MTRTGTRPSVAEILDKRFDIYLEQATEEANCSDDAEAIEKKLIHDWYNELETYKKAFKIKYKNQIRQNDKWYPRKWMEEDNLISALTKKYPLICDILNEIEARKSAGDYGYVYLLHPKGERFENEYPYGFTYKEKNIFAVFIADDKFYDTIVNHLGIAKITLQKHLQAFHKVGILKKLSNTGKYKNIPVYAIGYFDRWNDKFVLKRFLTSDNKKTLHEFNLYDTGISKNKTNKVKDDEIVQCEPVYYSQRQDIIESVKYRKRQ
jgi:hypothetical protein